METVPLRYIPMPLLKALQLSKVGLSTIKHQQSKISHHRQKPLEPKTHKNANCLHEFAHKRCSKCPPFAQTHAWRCFILWSIAYRYMSCWKSDHTAIKRSFSSLTLYILCSIISKSTNIHSVGNFPFFAAVKEFCKFIKNWQSYSHG